MAGNAFTGGGLCCGQDLWAAIIIQKRGCSCCPPSFFAGMHGWGGCGEGVAGSGERWHMEV